MSTDFAPDDHVVSQQRRIRESLPFGDADDFDAADRGFLGRLEPGEVRDDDGRVVWDGDAYAFLDGEAPDTVNPSLWRQSKLVARQGLYEVVPGIYQARGLDLSNVTFVEGYRGVLVIDPLISAETAAAALRLYRRYRGERDVTGVVYTHSHVDHFGGVKGVTTQQQVDAGAVPVLAPEGFLEAAVSENVYAGGAMSRRSAYMMAPSLPRGPRGQVGTGLGPSNSVGAITLIAPTVDIRYTGQQETVDGIRIVFQLAPGTEAPAEMHLHLPEFNALCIAENATHTLHNLLTLRGAQVRDARAWARYLTEAIDLFGEHTDVVFASHHWPTWGRDKVVEYLSLQRDLYAYLHDQTLRLVNSGYTGSEIAESLRLPPALERAWHARGYYGSVSHNVKAIYQRYLGWFDGNPAHLWQHPPVAAARRYVRFMGGADEVVAKARSSYQDGDFRWVAEVLNHVVFAEPEHEAARRLLAETYEQLGYGAENGTWRNFYLTGAHELRHGSLGSAAAPAAPDLFTQLSPAQLFDALAVRVNGPRGWDEQLTVDIDFTDLDERHRLTLRNGVLSHTAAAKPSPADVLLRLPRSALAVLVSGHADAAELAEGGVSIEGDPDVLRRLMSVLDKPDPDFAIVTP
ncbi:alkyl sulfatase-like hydrolase [Saccharomonospora marina XMU15]|uniref:Linear primary-alkylsulfatase n=1 Tax=Saccharomonospora marina XMU15 TaxID=882083 RepID=H5X4R9_9PSEU|nr:alkyl sulfatase dimerization domain-containing protein [Saccharomonospora marina]EHR51145.1 alkyl sulfatase-like hydrolase [Saccharomonospora marina XMU15]